MSDETPINEQDISDLDTARLALRGAVSTLRTLQDLVAGLKAENQELTVREKAWKARVETMEQRLSEIHAKWQESQTLLQDYKQEIALQIRNEIAVQEQEKWKAQLAKVQSTLQEWQKAREMREAELARTKELLSEREQDVRRIEQERIAFEHKTQAEIASLLEKARQALKNAVADAVEEKDQEIREVKAQWVHETAELKEMLRRAEIEMKLKEEELQKDFHQRRRELEALWRQREEEAWKQAEAIRAQTEAALQLRANARLEALAKEKEQQTADYQDRLGALDVLRAEQEKTLQAAFQQKEAEIRERYVATWREKEGQLETRRLELEQQALRRETELMGRTQKEEEALRNTLRELEAGLRKAADEETARRQEILKKELIGEKEAMQAKFEEERKSLVAERARSQEEASEKKSQLAEAWLRKEQAVLEEAFRKRESDLESRALVHEAEHRQAWLRKESELRDRYQTLIQEEQQKIQAQTEAQLKVLGKKLEGDFAERAKVLEQKYQNDLAEKEKVLEAQYWEKQAELKREWDQKEIALRDQIALQTRLRDAELQERAKKHLEAEIARQTQTLQERFNREAAIHEESLERQKKQLTQRQTALEQEFREAREKLRRDLEREKQAWVADLKRQMQDHIPETSGPLSKPEGKSPEGHGKSPQKTEEDSSPS